MNILDKEGQKRWVIVGRWLRWIKASTKIEYFGSLVQPNQILDSFEQARVPVIKKSTGV